MPEIFPITWVLTRFKRTKLMLAFCGKTNHAIKVDKPGALVSLVVQDLYIENGQCEEGRRCFYFACSLNRTSPENYQRDQGLKSRKPVNPQWGELDATELGFEVRGGYLMQKDKRGNVRPLIEMTR